MKAAGRMAGIKKINLMTHVLGETCNYRMRFFEVVLGDTKTSILKNFNLMSSTNDQNIFLFVCLTRVPGWFHNRQPEGEAIVNAATHKFRL